MIKQYYYFVIGLVKWVFVKNKKSHTLVAFLIGMLLFDEREPVFVGQVDSEDEHVTF